MLFLRRARRFLALAPPRRRLLLEAAVSLVRARLDILFVPFPRMARRWGALHEPGPLASVSEQEAATAREVAWAIDWAARLLPFRLVCLPRAVAAWHMLARRQIGCRIHFGAQRIAGEKSLRTHAWVKAGSIEVTGVPESYTCAEIGYYGL
jgi:hypothetical protein